MRKWRIINCYGDIIRMMQELMDSGSESGLDFRIKTNEEVKVLLL